MNLIYQAVRNSGGRLTKVRKAIIQVLSQTPCFLSKSDLIKQLVEEKINPVRSTIYRELCFLQKNNIIVKKTMAGVDYYEIRHDQHQHLVCLGCHSISPIEIDQHWEKQAKMIARQNKFAVLNHSLEFYGYCRQCLDKKV